MTELIRWACQLGAGQLLLQERRPLRKRRLLWERPQIKESPPHDTQEKLMNPGLEIPSSFNIPA